MTTQSEILIHNLLYQVVEQYHPFAEYVGYEECEEGFIAYYEGDKGRKAMLININGNVLADETWGTTRTLGAISIGLGILDVLFNGNQRNY